MGKISRRFEKTFQIGEITALKMLYYTYSVGGKIGAIYNGRLMFLHLESPAEFGKILELRSADSFDGLWEILASTEDGQEIARWNLIKKVLAHEFVHKQLYAHSQSGLILQGWRMWARAQYLLRGSLDSVRRYYKARAIFFEETREYQEDLAKELDSIEGENRAKRKAIFQQYLKERYLQKLVDSEKAILEKWRAERVMVCPSFLFRQFFQLQGKLLHQHFSIVTSYIEDTGDWRERWVTDGGLLNDLPERRPDETEHQVFLKALLNKARPERMSGRQTTATDLLWFRVSFQTQARILKSLYGYSERQILESVVSILEFVVKWAGVRVNPALVYEAADDALLITEAEFKDKWLGRIGEFEKNERLKKFVNFFYLHGN